MKFSTPILLTAATLLSTAQCAPAAAPVSSLATRQSSDNYGLWSTKDPYYLNDLYDYFEAHVKRQAGADLSSLEADFAKLRAKRQTDDYEIIVDSYDAIYAYQLWFTDFLVLVQKYTKKIDLVAEAWPQPQPLEY
ncbi:hypothetical protein H2200_000031 [Cladophialophora chaetospira]|uniref:Uncharacterized protein n=1 Tax=Cladophialophora chaetospira TaxID=386627 RepID=A0AA39CQJ6_9EURO|nr:hypothetical protein H2200_000031 [Cladophialophora chaetospira]